MQLFSALTCQQWVVGSKGFLDVEYTKGGVPVVLLPTDSLRGSGLCGNSLAQFAGNESTEVSSAKSFSLSVHLLLLTLLSSTYVL